MGMRNSKIDIISIPLLIRQLNDFNLPGDRHRAVETLEQIDEHLLEHKTLDVKSRQLKDSDGMYSILKTSKKLVEDVECISVLAQILDSVKLNTPLMMDFIQFGGLDLLDKSMRIHAKDDFLAVTLPQLQKVITAVGAAASIQVIQDEGLNLKLCQCCQEVILKSKNLLGTINKIVIPKSSDRANRVLRFMDNYMDRVDVQIAGLDAILNFCRNADAKHGVKETDVIPVLVKCLETHKQEHRVVWRVCMALAILASHHSDIAVNITTTNIHEVAIDQYPTFATEPVVQQQIIWMLASFLKWPRSQRELHKSAKSMQFFKSLVQKPEPVADDGSLMVELKEEVPATNEVTTTNNTLIELAIPVQVRSFLRETGGNVFTEKKQKKKAQVFKERRNFDERPKFGTVDTNIFMGGATGLLAGENDDEEGNDQGSLPEWEQKLRKNEEKYNKRQ